jgi:hypothetical protein
VTFAGVTLKSPFGLQMCNPSYATEPYRTDNLVNSALALMSPGGRIFSKPVILRTLVELEHPLAFQADAPMYIAVAKTRIPAAPVICERICGST